MIGSLSAFFREPGQSGGEAVTGKKAAFARVGWQMGIFGDKNSVFVFVCPQT